MKPVLVTGATGFLGKHLMLRLGEPVRVLCRSTSSVEHDSRIELIRGDITSPQDVDRAVKGARTIYHLAGVVSRNPADASRLERIHVEGTRLVCEAALRHGVERIVVASSSGTVAVGRRPVIHDENSGYKEREVARWPYYTAKIAQEKLALSYWTSHKLPVIVINPSLLLGPGDDRNSSTGDVAAFLEGQILSIPTGGLNFLDARDCAAGAIAAMERGRPGERYLLGGVNWNFREFTLAVAEVAGMRAPLLASPTWLSLLSAPLLRKLMPLAGRKFSVEDSSIEMAGMFWYCDCSKARTELGFTTRDPMETLRDTVEDVGRRLNTA